MFGLVGPPVAQHIQHPLILNVRPVMQVGMGIFAACASGHVRVGVWCASFKPVSCMTGQLVVLSVPQESTMKNVFVIRVICFHIHPASRGVAAHTAGFFGP